MSNLLSSFLYSSEMWFIWFVLCKFSPSDVTSFTLATASVRHCCFYTAKLARKIQTIRGNENDLF